VYLINSSLKKERDKARERERDGGEEGEEELYKIIENGTSLETKEKFYCERDRKKRRHFFMKQGFQASLRSSYC
jgi:hypothetical protein